MGRMAKLSRTTSTSIAGPSFRGGRVISVPTMEQANHLMIGVLLRVDLPMDPSISL